MLGSLRYLVILSAGTAGPGFNPRAGQQSHQSDHLPLDHHLG